MASLTQTAFSLARAGIDALSHSDEAGMDCGVRDRLSAHFGDATVFFAPDWGKGLLSGLLACGVGPRDEVIMPSLAPASVAHAIELAGAKPVFVDVESDTLLISYADVERRLTDATKAVIACHLYGQICSTSDLAEMLAAHSVALLEDGSDAFFSLAAAGSVATDSKLVFGCLPQARDDDRMHAFIATHDEATISRLSEWTQPKDVSVALDPDIPMLGLTNDLPVSQAACFLESMGQSAKYRANQDSQVAFYAKAFSSAPVRLLNSHSKNEITLSSFPVHLPPDMRDDSFTQIYSEGFKVYISYRSLADITYFKSKYKCDSCPNSLRWGQGVINLPTGFNTDIREQKLLSKYFEMSIFPKILERLA